MKKNSLISGIVTSFKSLGKISFISVSSGSETSKLVATYDQTIDCSKLINLKINDYIKVKTQKQCDEVHVIEVVEHLQNNKGIIPEAANIKAYAVLLNQIRSYFDGNGFTEVRLPTIHPWLNMKEIIEINFFGKKARMASSNALYITAMAANMSRAYSIQRYYRAEPIETFRHLSEFDMLEVAFIGHSFEDLISVLSNFISDILNRVKLLIPDQIMAQPFEKIPFVSYRDLNNDFDLSNKELGKYELEISKNGPIIVIHFPAKMSSWALLPLDNQYSYSLNFFVPGVGEVAEGGLRDTREPFLRHKFAKLGLCKELNWYVDLNPFPNSKILTFGLGIERLAMWLFGISNIRALNCFYRDKNISEISETMKYGK